MPEKIRQLGTKTNKEEKKKSGRMEKNNNKNHVHETPDSKIKTSRKPNYVR